MKSVHYYTGTVGRHLLQRRLPAASPSLTSQGRHSSNGVTGGHNDQARDGEAPSNRAEQDVEGKGETLSFTELKALAEQFTLLDDSSYSYFVPAQASSGSSGQPQLQRSSSSGGTADKRPFATYADDDDATQVSGGSLQTGHIHDDTAATEQTTSTLRVLPRDLLPEYLRNMLHDEEGEAGAKAVPETSPKHIPGTPVIPPGHVRYRVDVQYHGNDFDGWFKSTDKLHAARELLRVGALSGGVADAEALLGALRTYKPRARDLVEEALAVALDLSVVKAHSAVVPETGAHVRQLTCHVDIPLFSGNAANGATSSMLLLQPRTVMQRATLWLEKRAAAAAADAASHTSRAGGSRSAAAAAASLAGAPLAILAFYPVCDSSGVNLLESRGTDSPNRRIEEYVSRVTEGGGGTKRRSQHDLYSRSFPNPGRELHGEGSSFDDDFEDMIREDGRFFFDARHSAVRRTYVYRILNRIAPPLFNAGQQWHCPDDGYLDTDRMQRVASYLAGTNDYGCFVDPKLGNAMRKILLAQNGFGSKLKSSSSTSSRKVFGSFGGGGGHPGLVPDVNLLDGHQRAVNQRNGRTGLIEGLFGKGGGEGDSSFVGEDRKAERESMIGGSSAMVSDNQTNGKPGYLNSGAYNLLPQKQDAFQKKYFREWSPYEEGDNKQTHGIHSAPTHATKTTAELSDSVDYSPLTTRTIDRIQVTRSDDEVMIWFSAPASSPFLRHQIRNMVSLIKAAGASSSAAGTTWSSERELRGLLDQGFISSTRRRQRLLPPTAPIHGLTLWGTTYGPEFGNH